MVLASSFVNHRFACQAHSTKDRVTASKAHHMIGEAQLWYTPKLQFSTVHFLGSFKEECCLSFGPPRSLNPLGELKLHFQTGRHIDDYITELSCPTLLAQGQYDEGSGYSSRPASHNTALQDSGSTDIYLMKICGGGWDWHPIKTRACPFEFWLLIGDLFRYRRVRNTCVFLKDGAMFSASFSMCYLSRISNGNWALKWLRELGRIFVDLSDVMHVFPVFQDKEITWSSIEGESFPPFTPWQAIVFPRGGSKTTLSSFEDIFAGYLPTLSTPTATPRRRCEGLGHVYEIHEKETAWHRWYHFRDGLWDQLTRAVNSDAHSRSAQECLLLRLPLGEQKQRNSKALKLHCCFCPRFSIYRHFCIQFVVECDATSGSGIGAVLTRRWPSGTGVYTSVHTRDEAYIYSWRGSRVVAAWSQQSVHSLKFLERAKRSLGPVNDPALLLLRRTRSSSALSRDDAREDIEDSWRESAICVKLLMIYARSTQLARPTNKKHGTFLIHGAMVWVRLQPYRRHSLATFFSNKLAQPVKFGSLSGCEAHWAGGSTLLVWLHLPPAEEDRCVLSPKGGCSKADNSREP
nr:uncharacterized protein LOC109167247 [Ipomoea batatas]